MPSLNHSIQIDTVLRKLKGVYGISTFSDIYSPSSLKDPQFAEMCRIYLDLYEGDEYFIKYDPDKQSATEDVINGARHNVLQSLAGQLVDALYLGLSIEAEELDYFTYYKFSATLGRDSISISLYASEERFNEDLTSYLITNILVEFRSSRGIVKEFEIDCTKQDFSSLIDYIKTI